ncbi:MAG: TIGR00268 family protein [Proteobacteria bacterium]|nr:MAG: TIGR00268 family protein [Pseudomonadota bacterium]PIE17226.1 MAG: TIGR00268 family protein [Pseudomonadota bacterium]
MDETTTQVRSAAPSAAPSADPAPDPSPDDALTLDSKAARLRAILAALDGAMVCFSSGVDSTFLLAEAVAVLGDRAVALTADSPSLPRAELEEARRLARALGVARHLIVETDELARPAYAANPDNRCYHCKAEMLRHAASAAAAQGGATILVGTNVDDLGGHLPGLDAIQEAGARMPLVEAALTKAEIRALSRRAGLPSADKPEMACLASRFPTGTAITAARLERVERFEAGLAELGFVGLRVRFHEPIARLELAPSQFPRALDPARRERILELGRSLGFRFVALDLAGYRRGALSDLDAG